MGKSRLSLVAPAIEKRTVMLRRRPNAELRRREHLTEASDCRSNLIPRSPSAKKATSDVPNQMSAPQNAYSPESAGGQFV